MEAANKPTILFIHRHSPGDTMARLRLGRQASYSPHPRCSGVPHPIGAYRPVEASRRFVISNAAHNAGYSVLPGVHSPARVAQQAKRDAPISTAKLETIALADLYGVFFATMLLPKMKPNSAMARGWLFRVPP